MKQETDNLHESYLKKFSKLKENISLLTPEIYNAMTENLLIEYKREYAKMDSTEGIDADKFREELEQQRAEEIEKIKLEHSRLMADIKAQRNVIENDITLQKQIAAAKAEIMERELVPADLPRRWWQRRARPNRAKQLMLQDSYLDINQYFASLAENVQRREYGEGSQDLISVLSAGLPHPRGKRARAIQNQAIESLALYINAEIERRVKEQTECFGDTGGNDVPAQWLNDMDEMSDESDMQPTQAETPVKPKRKRRRKSEIEQTESEEPIEGQMAIEELGDETDKPPELAQSPEETEE